MAFQVSPGVLTKEIDLTNVVPAVATSTGAIAGSFQMGPVGEPVALSSEQDLVKIFGLPNTNNFENWMTASSFLQYGNSLLVARAESGIVNATGNGSGLLIKNTSHYQDNYADGSGSVGLWAARTAGTWGNSIGVSICSNATAFEESEATIVVHSDGASAGDTTIPVVNSTSEIKAGDIVYFQEADGQQYEVTAVSGADTITIKQLDNPNGGGLKTALSGGEQVRRRWRFYDLFDAAPGTSDYANSKGLTGDEMHIVVYDTTGDISGFKVDTNGERTQAVLETYAFVSQAASAKTTQGGTNYYPNVIYNQSSYIYWMDHDSSLTEAGTDPVSGTTFSSTSSGDDAVITTELSGGTDDYSATVGELKTAYELFKNADEVDVNLIMAGSSPAGTDGVTHATNLIDIAEYRKDVVVFISPRRADVVNVTDSITQTSNVKGFFDNLSSSSYAVFDSGYKYTYDKYNDVYRYIPLNGDIAGLCANTEQVADAWFSPAGYNRGQIRGVVKLAYNPNKSQRDILFPARVNPVITQSGQGTILFGDKTALSRPSAFDAINVRRLFIVLEKAISTASKFQLFELNDEFTRSQFRNLVEPFLRDIQARRGITDFKVVCDSTNNTGEVIDRNEFIADIFIKPARSIRYISLNFIATRTGVSFSEVGG